MTFIITLDGLSLMLLNSVGQFCKENSKFFEVVVDSLLFTATLIITVIGRLHKNFCHVIVVLFVVLTLPQLISPLMLAKSSFIPLRVKLSPNFLRSGLFLPLYSTR
jgi:hypothetical protein